MKNMLACALLASAFLAPGQASAQTPGIGEVKTFYGEVYGHDRPMLGAVARVRALERAASEGFGNCVETYFSMTPSAGGWYVISAQECTRQ